MRRYEKIRKRLIRLIAWKVITFVKSKTQEKQEKYETIEIAEAFK